MKINEIILLLIIGLMAGFMASMLGIGGGIIVIPELVFFFGYSQHQVTGTSLTFMLPPIGVLAAWNYYKEGFVNVKTALILMAVFVAGAYPGSLVSVHVPEKALKKVKHNAVIEVFLSKTLKKLVTLFVIFNVSSV